jgi:hypothetical protein
MRSASCELVRTPTRDALLVRQAIEEVEEEMEEEIVVVLRGHEFHHVPHHRLLLWGVHRLWRTSLGCFGWVLLSCAYLPWQVFVCIDLGEGPVVRLDWRPNTEGESREHTSDIASGVFYDVAFQIIGSDMHANNSAW